MIAILGFQLVFAIIPVFAIWTPEHFSREVVCKTSECSERGLIYKQSLNPTIHPCDNFYDFACGSWEKFNPGPKFSPEWHVVDMIYRKSLLTLRKIFESGHIKTSEKQYAQAQMVYDVCSKIPEYPRQNADVIDKEIAKLNSISPNVWTLHNEYLKLTGESGFFSYRILGNEGSRDPLYLHLKPPSSVYGAIIHHGQWTPEHQRLYHSFLFNVLRAVRTSEADEQIMQEITDVFEFRKALDDVIQRSKYRTMKTQVPKLKTPHDLKAWYQNAIPKLDKKNDIPLDEIALILLQGMPKKSLQLREIVWLKNYVYLLELATLLTETSTRILVHHMEIFFMERHLTMNGRMQKLLATLQTDMPTRMHYLRVTDVERWELCLKQHNMRETLGKLLVQRWFPLSYQEIVGDIITKVKEAMKRRMEASTWLDVKSQMDTARALDDLDTWVGFPPPYANNSVDPYDSQYDLTIPDAAINLDAGHIIVYASLLRSPLFDPEIPEMYNIAGIGATVGHELHHIIYDCGKMGIREDVMNSKLWWSFEMQKICLERKKCFITQYNKIIKKEMKYRYNVDVDVDTTTRFIENYADSMGLDVAYYAYKDAIRTGKERCQVLPGFERYSCDQMFFLSYANTLCARVTKAADMYNLVKSAHSPVSVRINGALMNNVPFSKAFKCPDSAPMNPKKKCYLWK